MSFGDLTWVIGPTDSREIVCFYVFWTAAFLIGLGLRRKYWPSSQAQHQGFDEALSEFGFANSLLSVMSPFTPATFEFVTSHFPVAYAFSGYYGLRAAWKVFRGP